MGGERREVVPPFIRDRYRHDLEFRQRIDYVCDRGIPYSVFVGRVVGDDEPYWLPEDREIVAVWSQEQAGRCRDCGTYQWEWDEWLDDDAGRVERPWHPSHYTCYGCKSHADYQKDVGNTVSDGTKFILERRPRGD